MKTEPIHLMTSHGRVLLHLARDPAARMRDVAAACGLTERAVQRIVAELEAAGHLTRTREGRRNRYAILTDVAAQLTAIREPDVAIRGPRMAGALSFLD